MDGPKVIVANQKEESIIEENKPKVKFNSHYIFLGTCLISYKSIYFSPKEVISKQLYLLTWRTRLDHTAFETSIARGPSTEPTILSQDF